MLGMEGRLASILYRMNFVGELFATKHFVEAGHILVNTRAITYPNFVVGVYDLVMIPRHLRYWMRGRLLFRMFTGMVYFTVPRYFVMDYF
jgi:hypothetical protein